MVAKFLIILHIKKVLKQFVCIVNNLLKDNYFKYTIIKTCLIKWQKLIEQ